MSRTSVPAALALGAAFLAPAVHASAQADRYGPAMSAPAPYAEPAMAGGYAGPASVPAAVRGRMLDWPGKTATQVAAPAPRYAGRTYAPPQAYAAHGYVAASRGRYAGGGASAPAPSTMTAAPAAGAYRPATAAYRVPSGYPVATAVPAYASLAAPSYRRPPSSESGEPPASAGGWRPVFAPPAAPAEAPPALAGAPQPAPTSIYTPASATPAAAAPSTAESRAAALPPPRGYLAPRAGSDTADASQGVRFYSVHRPFGIQPDPAPIPPQFFAATADLSEPPGPLPTERTTTSGAGAKSSSTVRAAPDSGVN